MKIIIAGAGKVGYSVAQMLETEGHDLTVIERDAETVSRLSNELDVVCVEGSATNPETLREAGAAEAELLIAATELDEVNMICGIAARKLGTPQIVARIRDPEYLHQTEFLRDALGIDFIVNPEYECAREISRILRFPSAVRVDTFSKGSAEIMEYRVGEGSRLDGAALKTLPSTYGAKVLVGVVERGGDAIIPNGDFVLKTGDLLSVTGSSGELRRFFTALGQYRRPVKNVMILGGGRIAVYLTRLLHESGIEATIVEADRARCDLLCDLVPYARIIHGDGTIREVLTEEGLERSDAFVALTGDDENNIITSMYAKRVNVPKIVTKVNREHLAEILLSYGIDSYVTPKKLIAQQLTGYVRALNNSRGSSMETMHRLADGKVEALEFKVKDGARIIGVPLKDLKLKPNVLISAVIHDNKTVIPGGATVIESGDHAVVVAKAGLYRDLDEIVEGRA